MFSNIIDLLNYYVIKNIFLFLIFYPWNFFENLTFKWVPLIGFWIKIIFLILFLHFTPRATTNNLPFLNTQNRPTQLGIGQVSIVRIVFSKHISLVRIVFSEQVSLERIVVSEHVSLVRIVFSVHISLLRMVFSEQVSFVRMAFSEHVS